MELDWLLLNALRYLPFQCRSYISKSNCIRRQSVINVENINNRCFEKKYDLYQLGISSGNGISPHSARLLLVDKTTDFEGEVVAVTTKRANMSE
ncbi:hypothetical protein CHS0354_005271 [Potamilus streckersoni]|uniref:Uncharacterized protein n=1 Tax=Potamilus streckersoni TaxID=2493646 RepID=A0AAE0S3K3_9BIVA|nr:hypothetical protein CHS0354_005271 [Potamilus streckersoni]